MKPATLPIHRPHNARLLVVDGHGRIYHAPRSRLLHFLAQGDLLVANDAATLPASLSGLHPRSGQAIEVRLAARPTLRLDRVQQFDAVVFGAGDWRMRTEDRPPPPRLRPGDRLALGPLNARIEALRGHPRLVRLRFDGTPDQIWAGLARHGRPVQYAHLNDPLRLWDVWTRIAALPVAFEAPSAGFVLDWALLDHLPAHGIGFATLTHAAGLSSTGDPALDARLPLPEPYHLPPATVQATLRTRERGGRIVALGTTVVRALEHAVATPQGLHPGEGMADQRLGSGSRLRIVDVLLSGTHEPGSSHYELLRAFADGRTLQRTSDALSLRGYRTHEFGDSMLIERSATRRADRAYAGNTRVPASPVTSASMRPSAPMAAGRPVPSAKRRAASTLGAIEPAANVWRANSAATT